VAGDERGSRSVSSPSSPPAFRHRVHVDDAGGVDGRAGGHIARGGGSDRHRREMDQRVLGGADDLAEERVVALLGPREPVDEVL